MLLLVLAWVVFLNRAKDAVEVCACVKLQKDHSDGGGLSQKLLVLLRLSVQGHAEVFFN